MELKKFLSCQRRLASRLKQQGFALIFVMVFIAMIMGIVGDVVYQTQVTAKNTMVQQDQVLADTAVRTGVEFAKFLLILNKLSSNYQNNPLIPIPKNLYSMLNGQPIGAESFKEIEGLTGIDFATVLSPPILNGLKAMKGYFVLKITTENAKFNLNLLQSTYSNTANKALIRLFSSPDTEKFLALYNYTPQQMVDNLTDYIKISVTDGSLDSRVMSDYNRLGLKYLPKHAALESLEELRRIPGFEVDDIYNMFSPYFTVWPISGPQNSLNINSAPTELISALMTPQSQEAEGGGWDKFDDNRIKNTYAQNNIGSWFQANLQSFSQDPDADEIRKNIFGVTDSVFRVECRGVVNNLERNFVLIIQQNQTANSGTGGGQGSGAGSGSGSGSGSGAGSGSGTPPTTPGASPPGSTPFTILSSQWVD